MNKDIVRGFIDKTAFVFFILMAFFIPSSNAIVEICFGAILFCFLLKTALKRSCLDDIKEFFGNRINLSLLMFFIFMGFLFNLCKVFIGFLNSLFFYI